MPHCFKLFNEGLLDKGRSRQQKCDVVSMDEAVSDFLKEVQLLEASSIGRRKSRQFGKPDDSLCAILATLIIGLRQGIDQ